MTTQFANLAPAGALNDIIRIVPREVRRRLLRNFDVAFVHAPPGFGRAALIEWLMDEHAGASYINLEHASDLREFLHFTARALNAEPAPTDKNLGAALGAILECPRLAHSSVVIFDCIDAVMRLPELRGALSLLLHLMPRQTKAVLFSVYKDNLSPLLLKDGGGRRSIARVNSDDLLLQMDDVIVAFGDAGVDTDLLHEVLAHTYGWYAGVAAYYGQAMAGELERALMDPLAPGLARLRAFIFREVLPLLTSEELHQILSLVAMGVDDAPDTAGFDESIIASAMPPLLEKIPKRFIIATLLEHFGSTIGFLRRNIAVTGAKCSDWLKAAKFYLDGGDTELANVCADRGLSNPATVDFRSLLQLITSIDATQETCTDKVWCTAMRAVDTCVAPHLEDLEYLNYGNLRKPEARDRARLLIALMQIRAGKLNEAQDVLDSLKDDPQVTGIALLVRALIYARFGRIDQAWATWREGMKGTAHPGPFTESWLKEMRTYEALYAGQWELAFGHLGELAPGAEVAADGPSLARSSIELMVYSWLCGTAPENCRHCEGGREDLNVACSLSQSWFPVARRALGAATPRDAQRWAQELVGFMSDVEIPLLAIANRIIVGEILPERHQQCLAECQEIVESTDSLSMRQAVAAWSKGEERCGMFSSLVERARLHNQAKTPAPFRLEVFSGRLFREGQQITLTERAFEILAALALRGKVPREELAELLWPGTTPERSANALKQALHRLRIATDSREIVRFAQTSYELSDEVVVDVHLLEQLLRPASNDARLAEPTRQSLTQFAEVFAISPIVACWDRWEWSYSISPYLDALRRRTLLLLARDAFDRKDMLALDGLVRLMLLIDSCDVDAYQLAIRAALEQGRRDIARQRYDQYRAILSRELDVDEEDKLAPLLEDTRPPKQVAVIQGAC